jgi:acetolactate synthase I/II/III large subunit
VNTPPNPTDQNVSDYLIERIASCGVETIFGLTGGGVMHVLDSIARSSKVNFQAVHHEQYAGVAADGYSRAGKNFGVALATTGPGATNLFTSVAAAWQDSSPVLFVVGQVKRSDSSRLLGLSVRQNGTFEFDSLPSYAPITKGVFIPASAEEAITSIETAIILMNQGRPGPVVIELPLDVQALKVDSSFPSEAKVGLGDSPGIVSNISESHSFKGERTKFRQSLSAQLKSQPRPLVLLGAGTLREKSIRALTRELDSAEIPYIVTQFARQVGEINHSLYLGSPGIKANRSANMAMVEASLIVAIGTSLHQQVIGWDSELFKSLPSWKIWSELDPKTLAARQDLVDEAFHLDCEASVSTLLEVLGELKLVKANNPTTRKWRERCYLLRGKYLLHYPESPAEHERLCLYEAVSELSAFSSSFEAVTADAGVTWYALAQHYFPSPDSFYISSGSFGAMGMAVSYALGAAIATGGSTCAVIGDGSLMTCLSELASVKDSNANITVIVNSNDGYLSIKSTQDRFFKGRRLGTDASTGVWIPSIESIASTFDLPFFRVETKESLSMALKVVTDPNCHGPAIIEMRTKVNQKVEPYLVSSFSADGSIRSGGLGSMYPYLDVEEKLDTA